MFCCVLFFHLQINAVNILIWSMRIVLQACCRFCCRLWVSVPYFHELCCQTWIAACASIEIFNECVMEIHCIFMIYYRLRTNLRFLALYRAVSLFPNIHIHRARVRNMDNAHINRRKHMLLLNEKAQSPPKNRPNNNALFYMLQLYRISACT